MLGPREAQLYQLAISLQEPVHESMNDHGYALLRISRIFCH
jgi:hypothetical protein